MNLRQSVSNDIIETLAESEHALARNLAVHREMLHVTLALLHERGCELGRLRDAHHRLHGEYRRLRNTRLRDERRAAA